MEVISKKSKVTSYLEGIGLLTGMILGAGIFALPFTLSRSGLFWGMLHFSIALFLMIILQFLYGEVAYFTDGRHRFTGYVRMYIGKKASHLAFITTLLGYYGTLIVYALFGGIFLHNIINGFPASSGAFSFSLIFFILVTIFSFLKFEKVGMINFYLTLPLLFFILYLLMSSWPLIDPGNFTFDFSFNEYWFLPYGVWLFSLAGFAVIPEVRDVMRATSLFDFKIVILTSVLVAAIFSLIFALGVLGVSGAETSKDALFGLKMFLGEKGIIIGSLIGFLAVFTSYLAMIADLKEIFKLDYNINKHTAWLLSILPPVIFFLLGVSGLVAILSFVGAVGLGISGIFILEMSDKIKASEAVVSHFRRFFKWLIGAAILLGSIYEIWHLLV